jgi:hypothetical protein
MEYFHSYLKIILMIKIIFILLAIYGLFLHYYSPTNKKLLNIVTYWKSRSEFVLITLMSILFMYLFNPLNDHIDRIDSELKVVLFLFGFTLLLTENLYYFIHTSSIFSKNKFNLKTE